jgi:predicted phage-related endonuclease
MIAIAEQTGSGRVAGSAAAGRDRSAWADGGDPIERRPITDRAEWLAWRMQDVTASDIGALFGVHPYGKSALALWADKQGLTAGLADDPMLRRGRWGEAAVIEMLADERPTWTVRRSKVYLRDRTIRLGGTPDAEAIDPERDGRGAVQCKVISESVFEREWTNGAPPLGFQLQTLTEMMLERASWGAIAALVIERFEWTPVIFELERHEAAEARIRAAVATFWANFEAGLAPALDPEKDAEVVSQIYPRATVKQPPLDLSGDNAIGGQLTRRWRLQRLAKKAQQQVEMIETAIKSKVGPYERAIAPGWRISWKNEPRKGHTVAPSNPRVLRIHGEKGR